MKCGTIFHQSDFLLLSGQYIYFLFVLLIFFFLRNQDDFVSKFFKIKQFLVIAPPHKLCMSMAGKKFNQRGIFPTSIESFDWLMWTDSLKVRHNTIFYYYGNMILRSRLFNTIWSLQIYRGTIKGVGNYCFQLKSKSEGGPSNHNNINQKKLITKYNFTNNICIWCGFSL